MQKIVKPAFLEVVIKEPGEPFKDDFILNEPEYFKELVDDDLCVGYSVILKGKKKFFKNVLAMASVDKLGFSYPPPVVDLANSDGIGKFFLVKSFRNKIVGFNENEIYNLLQILNGQIGANK